VKFTTQREEPNVDPAGLDPDLFRYYVRDEGPEREPYEKVVVVPQPDNPDPSHHAWSDARFATDIMAEHAEFFALLMPPELAMTERQQGRHHGRARSLRGPPPRP
jgi:hypothetical protein